MIAFEQLAVWEAMILSVVSFIVFGGGLLYAWHLSRRDQRSTNGHIKDEMLMTERKWVKRETALAAIQRAGG